MLKQIDWIAYWFELYKEHHEYTDFPIGITNTSGEIEWSFFPHQQFDGLSALKTVIDVSIPSKIAPSSFLKYIIGMMNYLKNSKLKTIVWNTPITLDIGHNQIPQTLLLNNIEYEKLVSTSKEQGVSINTLIISLSDRAVRKYLLKETQQQTYWFIPYNMRGTIQERPERKNYVSHVVAILNKQDSIQSIEKNVKNVINSNYYLGAWAFLHIGVLLGKNGARKILNYLYLKNHSWCGSISNLGCFKVENFKNAVYFCPPVTRPYPIGIGSITVNKSLTISFLFHPSLNLTSERKELILNELKNEITSL